MPRARLDEGRRLSYQDEIKAICDSESVRLADKLNGLVAKVEHAAKERLDQALEQAAETAQAELSGILGEISGSIRKIRAVEDPNSVLTELVNAVARSCSRAALFLHSGGNFIGLCAAGFGPDQNRSALAHLSVEGDSAPAIAHAVESRETVVTEATAHNLSQTLCREFAYEPGDQVIQVTLYPLTLRNTVLGVLLVDGHRMHEAVIEAMILTAEAWIEALGSRSGNGEDGDPFKT